MNEQEQELRIYSGLSGGRGGVSGHDEGQPKGFVFVVVGFGSCEGLKEWFL